MIDSLLQIINNEFFKADLYHIFINFLDIFVIFLIIYFFLYLLKGTEAIPVLFGLFFIYFSYILFSFLELTTATWVFSTFSQYIALVIVIIFKDDIRKTLAKIGKNNLISRHNSKNTNKLESVDELSKAVQTLSKKKIGALILIQLEAELKDRVTGQVPIDANVKKELLEAIFHHNSPIHDGAVIIIDDRIAYASAFLPLCLSFFTSSLSAYSSRKLFVKSILSLTSKLFFLTLSLSIKLLYAKTLFKTPYLKILI